MKLSILIASKDREQICKKLVHSINEQLTDSYIEYEIIVLDDCSDNKYDFKEKNTRIINGEKNIGASAARNRLIDESRYGFIFVLDDDVELEKNVIVSMVKCIESSGADMVCPRKIDRYKDGRVIEYSFFKPRFFTGNLKKFSPKNGDLVPFGGMTYLARKSCVWYDVDFGCNQYGERGHDFRSESAMQADVAKIVANLDSVVIHNADLHSGGSVRNNYWIGYGNALFINKYLPFGFIRSILWVCSWGVGHCVLNKFDFRIFKGWLHGMMR